MPEKAPVPLVPGNINLYRQPQVLNPDGTVSTVDSQGFNIDGVEVLLPSVTEDGRHLRTDDEILGEYAKTGRHLGKFATQAESDAFGRLLHEAYAAGKFNLPGKKRTFVNGVPIEPAVSHR